MTDEPDEPSLEDILGEDPKPAAEPKKVRKAKAEEPRLHPLLTNAEVEAAKAKARSRVEAERKAAAIEALEQQETERLRIEEGLTTGIGAMDEIVSVTIDLPPYADKISVNGPLGSHYYHGKTYDVPRHVAASLAEMMGRMWRHEDQVEGRDLRQTYARKRDTSINARTGAVHNAPARFDA